MGRAYHRAISLLRALLLFPVRPSAAAAALARRPVAALAALGPPALLLAYLPARGCGAADAAATALGLLCLVLGMGLGGALAAALAGRLAGAAPGGVPVHLVFGAWGVLLFLLAAAGAAALGLGAAAPLAAALAVLVWGVVAGTGVVGAGAETGRALVASCTGAAGAIAGAVVTGVAVFAHLVLAVPAPSGAPGVPAGTPLLVRPDEAPPPGTLVLLRDPPALARAAPGAPPPLGRVFFLLGGRWGGRTP
jgi:hypothetical protein